MEGLDAWCYDAISRQAWTDGSDFVTLLRTAGSSTYLTISFDLEGPLDCRLTGVDLLAPGCSRLDVAVPGPESAGGLYDWPLLAPRHESRRLLVSPGPGVVPVAVTVRGPQLEGGYQDMRVEHTWPIEVPPHTATALHLTVDACAWPKLEIVGRPGATDVP